MFNCANDEGLDDHAEHTALPPGLLDSPPYDHDATAGDSVDNFLSNMVALPATAVLPTPTPPPTTASPAATPAQTTVREPDTPAEEDTQRRSRRLAALQVHQPNLAAKPKDRPAARALDVKLKKMHSTGTTANPAQLKKQHCLTMVPAPDKAIAAKALDALLIKGKAVA